MKVFKRAAAVVAVATLTAVSAGPIASGQAAITPRLAGKYSVKSTITAHRHNPGDVGATSKSTWKFTPKCSGRNGCKTTAVRHRLSGHPARVTSVLSPVVSGAGPYHYKGTTTYLSGCFLDAGGVVDRAYSSKETYNLTVVHTNDNNLITSFKGTVVLVFTPTAVGRSHNCRADRITLGVKSLARL